MNDVDAENVMNSFPIRVQNLIKEIYTDGKIGISSSNIKIHIPNVKFKEELRSCRNSLMLEIPYASKQLYWEVMFNDEDETLAPEFDFTNDSFLSDPEPNTISLFIPSLANWNISNTKSLVGVIREFFDLYKKVQISTMKEKQTYSRFADEYCSLVNKLQIPEDNFEVFIEKNGCVHFLINMNINFSALPPYIQPVLFGDNYNLLNPYEDSAVLRASFAKLDSAKFSTDLQLSPRVEQVIGHSGSLHIPKCNKEKSLSMYVQEVSQILTERVINIATHFVMKKEYMQVLISRCAPNILEYNNKLFKFASFMCDVDSFPVLVTVYIGRQFPQQKPKVVLHSIFQATNSKPLTSSLDNYPYSPRWKPQEMIDRLLKNLNEEIPRFLIACQSFIDRE